MVNNWYHLNRLSKFALDPLVWSLATIMAFFLRLDERVLFIWPSVALYLLATLPIKVLAVKWGRLHTQTWRKVGVRDLRSIIIAVSLATLAHLLVVLVFQALSIGVVLRSIPFIEGALAILSLSMLRMMMRLSYESQGRAQTQGETRNVLIAGAGEAGTLITRDLLRHPESGLRPVGFVDDDPARRQDRIMGLPVLGSVSDLHAIKHKHPIDELLIAMPSAGPDVIRNVVRIAQKAEVPYRIIPGLYEIASGQANFAQIRDVQIEDLLRRDPVQLNTRGISEYLTGRTVLITGAGGSIGSEVMRQVLAFHPARLILVGRGENSLYQVQQELRRDWPELAYEMIVADISRRDRVANIFATYQPEIVFHAAAHKHVPLMEQAPWEAVLNNVVGTRNLAETALAHGVERFVNISTDKAVNPTSIMGASKRVSEMVVEHVAEQAAEHQIFVSVRFGNVLGSRGSVVPIFQEQIRRGGPVTVTDERMVRYFMTIPEASQLVLQAGSIGQNGMVYVLDMGQPVRIVDLARDLIMLCGVKHEVEVVFTGIRPGEKLYEELLSSEEGTYPSDHEKIFVVGKIEKSSTRFEDLYNALIAAAEAMDEPRIRKSFKALIPTYEPGGVGKTPPPNADQRERAEDSDDATQPAHRQPEQAAPAAKLNLTGPDWATS